MFLQDLNQHENIIKWVAAEASSGCCLTRQLTDMLEAQLLSDFLLM